MGQGRAALTVVVGLGLGLGLAACGPGRGARGPGGGCPETGPVLLTSDEDVAAVAGCARLPGLTVRTAAPLDLARLTALTVIDGDLRLGPTLAITTVSLPALTEVTGTLR